MNYSRMVSFFAVLTTLALAGCSSNKMIVSEWASPAYVSPSFRRIMIGGVDGQSSIRRNFEDEFVGQLRRKGVDALASYRYIPEENRLDDVKLKIGESYRVTPGTIHQMIARTDCDVLEVSTPEIDDVVRLSDKYGREGTSEP